MARNPENLKNLVPGNKRGPSKTTKLLKDAVLQAAQNAGGPDGMVGYLTTQATESPSAFLGLLGKILPLQVNGAGDDGAHKITFTWQK